jgi:drug/metabolite transporter (DMT)-like permease
MTLSTHRAGLLFCLVSATGFAAMPIFAKYAYAEGANVITLLAVRFVLAALLLWPLARMRGAVGSGRALIGGALLGLVGYAVESGLFFAALTRLDASTASLVMYVYPALVLVGAVLTGRERLDRRRAGALLASSAGVSLVLLGGDLGAIDGLGILMALTAAAGYAIYILGSDAIADGASPLAFSAAVCTGAANAFVIAGLVTGELDLGMSAAAYGWVALLAVVSTVLAITAFLAGIARLGPGKAAILSTIEPPITVALAMVCFGDSLALLQLGGGALVLSAVALLAQRSSASSEASASAGNPLTASSLRHGDAAPPDSSQLQVSPIVAATGRTATAASAR